MGMELDKMVEMQLTRHEGVRLKPYRDTMGKLTIGIGRNLDDVGINYAEVIFMMRNDISRAHDSATKLVAKFSLLSVPRQAAIINMIFNLGEAGFSKFQRMIAAINAGDFEVAAKEMLESRWATQVGKRAVELANIMKTGEINA